MSEDRLRILLVAHGMPSQNVGGVELYTLSLARMFSELHTVTLCVPDPRPAPPRLEIVRSVEGFDVASIRKDRKKRRFLELYSNPGVDESFCELLDSFSPDVVHVHHLLSLSTGVVTESSRRGIPVVLTLHDFWMNCPRGQRIARDGTVCRSIDREKCISCVRPQWQGIHRSPTQAPRRIVENLLLGASAGRRDFAEFDELMRKVFGAIDRVISPSRAMLADFAAYGVDESKMMLLRYCLDGSLKSLASAETGVSQNGHDRERTSETVRIGYLGTLIPTKGVHLLTDAFRELRDLPVSLDIHGVAPPYRGQRGYLQQLERGVAGDPRVRFRGPYERGSLPAILKGLDVVVVPSVWMENFPQTALEALTAGVPVVAANHGGLAEIVRSGVNGLKFDPGNSQDLATKLRMLVTDPGLRNRLSGRGVKLPAPEEHIQRHLSLYREVIEERKDRD